MRITKFGIDGEGHSSFAELNIELADAGEIGMLSDVMAATGVIFRETLPTYDYDWHCALRRQFVVLLDGEIEIEVSKGDRRRFAGGHILLLEETHGRGHRTRAISPGVRRSLFVVLPDPDE